MAQLLCAQGVNPCVICLLLETEGSGDSAPPVIVLAVELVGILWRMEVLSLLFPASPFFEAPVYVPSTVLSGSTGRAE